MAKPWLMGGNRLLVVLASLAVAIGGFPTMAKADGTPPWFELPFPCGQVWQGSTYHSNTGFHDKALDFNRATGDKGKWVVASGSGVVALGSDGLGEVTIDHDGGWETRYLHMTSIRTELDGVWVAAGTRIGKVGDVGGGSTGPHLHYEQKHHGSRVHISFSRREIGSSNSLDPDYYFSPTEIGPDYRSRNCFTPGNRLPDFGGQQSVIADSDLVLRRGNRVLVDYNGANGINNLNFALGKSADQVFVGDFGGDTDRDDIALRRGNEILIYFDGEGGEADRTFTFGSATDQVFVGNFGGAVDRDDLIRRRGNKLYIDHDGINGKTNRSVSFGKSSDEFYVGDFGGSTDIDDFVVRSGNYFRIDFDGINGKSNRSFSWGHESHEVFIADFGGDFDRDDLVLRNGQKYYIDFDAANGKTNRSFTWGAPTHQAFVGDFGGASFTAGENGIHARDDLVLWNGTTFYFDYDGNGTRSDATVRYGKRRTDSIPAS